MLAANNFGALVKPTEGNPVTGGMVLSSGSIGLGRLHEGAPQNAESLAGRTPRITPAGQVLSIRGALVELAGGTGGGRRDAPVASHRSGKLHECAALSGLAEARRFETPLLPLVGASRGTVAVVPGSRPGEWQ